MRTITVEQFQTELKAQGTSSMNHVAFICPMCKFVQSATSLIKAGAGKNLNEVEKYLGFSCVGRFTKAGSPRKKPDGKPCNWTLGGLLGMWELEVLTHDGGKHPRFEVATPEQAQKLEKQHAEVSV